MILAQLSDKAIETGGNVATESIKAGASVSEVAFLFVILVIAMVVVVGVLGGMFFWIARAMVKSQENLNEAHAAHLPVISESVTRSSECLEQLSEMSGRQDVLLADIHARQKRHDSCAIDLVDVALEHTGPEVAAQLRPIRDRMTRG